MLVGLDTMLPEARKGKYAVGLFDVNNMETTLALLEAATEKRSPVIIGFGEGGTSLIPMELLVAAVKECAAPAPVPVAIMLDHGRSLEAAVRSIRSGATSVMYDGSTLSFEENVERTREVVKVAHAVGIAVEAEIGHVGQGTEYANIAAEKDKLFTRPDQAAEFVRLTNVDALAVACGTAHGVYVGTPVLDCERLSAIRDAVPVPLVLHGGSGTGDDNLAQAVACGISKVNIYTDMAMEAKARIHRRLSENYERVRFTELLAESKSAFKDIAAHYMDVFGSTGKA